MSTVTHAVAFEPAAPARALAGAAGGIVLTLLCWPLFFHHLDRRDLWNSHEGRAAQDAQTVADDGMLTLPRLYDGQLELQKPPLYYWCVAGLADLRGAPVDALCVRLPSALAAWICVLALYGWSWLHRRPLLGFAAAAMLATAMHFTWSARIGRIDMPLTCCITIALLLLLPDGRRIAFGRLAAYMFLTLAVLLKGPIGLVLPLAVIGAWWAFQRDSIVGYVRRLGLWWGLPLVLAVSLPYYLWLQYATHGEFLRVFFWYHNVERGFGSEVLREHPAGLYLGRMALDLFPWILFLPLALWQMFRRRLWQEDRLAVFGAVWFVTMLVVLSCARFKRADYLLPAYPGFFLFLGSAMERWLAQVRCRQLLIGGWCFFLLTSTAGWMWYVDITLPAGEAMREYRSFALDVRSRAPAPKAVWFFRTESHTLAFHLGRPIRTFVQWEDLERLTSGTEPAYVVMPEEQARQWRDHLPADALQYVTDTDQRGVRHEKPLVLLRTCPAASTERKGRTATYVRAD